MHINEALDVDFPLEVDGALSLPTQLLNKYV